MENSKEGSEVLFNKLKEIFEFFQKIVMPIYSEVIIVRREKPVPILLEFESFFFHLMKAILDFHYIDKDKEKFKKFESNLNRAQAHIERLGLDAVKLLWVHYSERIEELFKKELISFQELKEFEKKSKEARLKEIESLGDRLPSKELVIKKYLEAIEYIKKCLLIC